MRNVIIIFALLFSSLANAQSINWSSPIDVAPSTNGNAYPRIVDNAQGKIFVTWGGNNNVYFSANSGSGFSTAKQLNNTSTPAYIADWTGAELDVKGDSVYVVFMHNVWKQKTYLTKSFNGGNTFSVLTQLENYADSTSRFPIVAVGPDGQPHISYMKMDTNGKHPHYVFRKSTDYGTTFGNERVVGNVSGPASEACDCCPAAIKTDGNKVAVFYRDNLNDIRDIYTGVSTNGGANFNGFAIDNNNWFIQACPSSGPDGIIRGDSLYSVFFSNGKCYFSSSSLTAGAMNTITQLGATAGATGQNFPRIDNHQNKTAIVWRGISGGTKLLLHYTDNITIGSFEVQDTLTTNSFQSADVAVTADAIHVVWQDNAGTVKYSKGTFGPSGLHNITSNIELSVFPNPARAYLNIISDHDFVGVKIYTSNGQLISNTSFESKMDISNLAKGNYILEFTDAEQHVAKKFFSKE